LTLKLSGSQADIDSFLDMLSECSGFDVFLDGSGNVDRSPGPPSPASNIPFGEALDELLNNPNELTIKLDRSSGNVLVDRFCWREIDLDDLDKFPLEPSSDQPSIMTRCEVLIHIIVEYNHALNEGRTECNTGREDAHKAGLIAQEKHRTAIGQPEGEIHSQVLGWPDFAYTEYCNGARTVRKRKEGNVTGVWSEEPEEKQEEPSEPLEPTDQGVIESSDIVKIFNKSDVVFIGKVLKIGKSPGAWSSFDTAYQEVTYKIIDYLKGKNWLGHKELIHHIILEQSILVEKQEPCLSKKIFVPGRKLIVFINLRKDPFTKGKFRFESTDANIGAIVLTDKIKEMLMNLSRNYSNQREL